MPWYDPPVLNLQLWSVLQNLETTNNFKFKKKKKKAEWVFYSCRWIWFTKSDGFKDVKNSSLKTSYRNYSDISCRDGNAEFQRPWGEQKQDFGDNLFFSSLCTFFLSYSLCFNACICKHSWFDIHLVMLFQFLIFH